MEVSNNNILGEDLLYVFCLEDGEDVIPLQVSNTPFISVYFKKHHDNSLTLWGSDKMTLLLSEDKLSNLRNVTSAILKKQHVKNCSC